MLNIFFIHLFVDGHLGCFHILAIIYICYYEHWGICVFFFLPFNFILDYTWLASQVGLVVKNLPTNAGDIREAGSIPGSGRSPGEGHGQPLQYSCQENPIERRAWWAIVHGFAQSRTWLKQFSMPGWLGFPVAQVVKSLPRPGFDPWVGKTLWRRKWQSTPVFLSGKSHGQRSLMGSGP